MSHTHFFMTRALQITLSLHSNAATHNPHTHANSGAFPCRRLMYSISFALLIVLFTLGMLPSRSNGAVLSKPSSFDMIKNTLQIPKLHSHLHSKFASSRSTSMKSSFGRDLNTEAASLSNTYYERVTSSSPGCPFSIDHGVVDDRDDLPPGIHGILSYNAILVNGQECSVDADDDEMYVSSFTYIETNEGVGNIANLTSTATDSIFVAGLDLALRKCGDYSDAFLNQYYFVEDLRPLHDELVAQGLLVNGGDSSDVGITDEQLADERGWMVSLPQTLRDPFRICVFKKDGLSSPTPIASPSSPTSDDVDSTPLPEDDDEEAEPVGDDTSSEDGSGAGTSAEDDPAPPPAVNSTFGEASDAASTSTESQPGSACFPATATVRLSSGVVKQMRDISIGDNVQASFPRASQRHSESNDNHFSPVFFFSHRELVGYYTFVHLETQDNRSLVVSPSHYVYLTRGLVPARSVRVGDSLISDSFTNSACSTTGTVGADTAVVTSISYTRREGLFNPHTMNGDVIVDGFRTSCYTEAIPPSTAHAFLAPLRAAFARFRFTTKFLDKGHPSIFTPLLSTRF